MISKSRVGQRFGLLVVQSEHMEADGKQRRKRVKCLCDCERHHIAWMHSLVTGNTKSCGCYIPPRNHGLSATPEYRCHQMMIQRCHNLSYKGAERYGRRGTKVCQGWRESFRSFLADMGNRPTPKHSIDRMNSNGHYSCGKCEECIREGWSMNCRWATPKEQNRNMRSNVFITFNGITLCQKDWAARLGIDYGTLRHRLRTWTLERAFSTPVKHRG